MKYLKSFNEKLYHKIKNIDDAINWTLNHKKLPIDNRIFNELKNRYSKVSATSQKILINSEILGEIRVEFFEDSWTMIEISNEISNDNWTLLNYICDDEGIFDLLDDLTQLCDGKKLSDLLYYKQRSNNQTLF